MQFWMLDVEAQEDRVNILNVLKKLREAVDNNKNYKNASATPEDHPSTLPPPEVGGGYEERQDWLGFRVG